MQYITEIKTKNLACQSGNDVVENACDHTDHHWPGLGLRREAANCLLKIRKVLRLLRRTLQSSPRTRIPQHSWFKKKLEEYTGVSLNCVPFSRIISEGKCTSKYCSGNSMHFWRKTENFCMNNEKKSACPSASFTLPTLLLQEKNATH